MFEEYRSDPSSVSESWREFFADYVPGGVATAAVPAAGTRTGAAPRPAGRRAGPAPVARAASVPDGPAAPAAAAAPTPVAADAVTATVPPRAAAPPPHRWRHRCGARRRAIAQNMAASLSVPTATSVRTVPAKLLEVNRSILNQHLARTSGGKVSFTHLIGFAVVRALEAVPALNSSFVPDVDGTGKPGVVRHDHVGLGLAVDLEKSDGTRTLLVPVIDATPRALDFRGFVIAYEDLVRKVHTAKATPDDFAGRHGHAHEPRHARARCSRCRG